MRRPKKTYGSPAYVKANGTDESTEVFQPSPDPGYRHRFGGAEVAERRYPVGSNIDLHSAPDLQANLLALVNTKNNVVLDCADVGFVDSSGIGVFVDIQRCSNSTAEASAS